MLCSPEPTYAAAVSRPGYDDTTIRVACPHTAQYMHGDVVKTKCGLSQQSVSQSVLHGESSPLRKCNDPCTSRGLKGHQSSCKKLDLSWTEKYNT